MFTLRVLGTISLQGPDGNRVGSVLSQPKRLGLLVLLSSAGPRRIQRDTLVGHLWPELPQDVARKRLRQGLYYLRRSLGAEVINGSGSDALCVSQERVCCDAVLMEEAAKEGNWEEVLALYEGDFMPGFFLDGGPPAFEHWVDSTRDRLKRTAAEAARRLAQMELAAGNDVAAGAAARRAWQLADWGEPALRELLELLIQIKDFSGARAAYSDFACRLKDEFGASPSADTQRIIQELPEDPGDLPRKVTHERSLKGSQESHAPRSSPAASTRSSPTSEAAPWRNFSFASLLWVGVVAGAILSMAVALMGGASPEQREIRPTNYIYMEPARDLTADGGRRTFAEGVETELAARLNEAGLHLVLLDEEPEDPLQGIRLQPALVEGPQGLRLSVMLLDARSGAILDRLATPLAPKTNASPGDVANQMAPLIRRTVGELVTRNGLQERDVSPAALAAVRAAVAETELGVNLRSQRATTAALDAFRAADSLYEIATQESPEWQAPLVQRAELAVEIIWLHLLPPAVNLHDAHTVALDGIKVADVAVAQSSSAAQPLVVRGILRHWAAATAPTRSGREALTLSAEKDLLQATALDPGLPKAWDVLSVIAEERQDYSLAYRQARRAYRADRYLEVPYDILARLFTNAVRVGDADGTQQWCTQIAERAPKHWMGTYCDLSYHASFGPTAIAMSDSLRRKGIEQARSSGTQFRSLEARFNLLHAIVLAKSGNTAKAQELVTDAAAVPPHGAAHTELLERVQNLLRYEGGEFLEMAAP